MKTEVSINNRTVIIDHINHNDETFVNLRNFASLKQIKDINLLHPTKFRTIKNELYIGEIGASELYEDEAAIHGIFSGIAFDSKKILALDYKDLRNYAVRLEFNIGKKDAEIERLKLEVENLKNKTAQPNEQHLFRLYLDEKKEKEKIYIYKGLCGKLKSAKRGKKYNSPVISCVCDDSFQIFKETIRLINGTKRYSKVASLYEPNDVKILFNNIQVNTN